jgi:hypothetical protein
VPFAGRNWLIPLSDAYVLLFIGLVVGAGVRVFRAPLARPALGRRRTTAPSAGT